ncbi:DMT family transporter [Henriciella sp. AS95]|uniref:DMT family transporter n=1 Tax=Henriciella sp. AS95 TaxID=3135782 RepID=UPI00318228CE
MTPQRSMTDWSMFLLLSGCWASAFLMTKVAVQDLPASVIIPSRLIVGAICMWAVMLMRGERLPPLSATASWLSIIGLGVIGTAVPFYLITLGQKTINASTASLLIAGAPLFVAGMAHFRFKDDRMTVNKVIGLIVGFIGVAVLLGPDAIKGIGNANLIAQLLVLGGALCYAVNSIIARGAPKLAPAVMPAGFLTVASVVVMPMLFFTDWDEVTFNASNVSAVLALGLVPTAFAGVVLMELVSRTSATFISLTGYVIPIMTVILGYVFFRETQNWNALLAFVLILAGVWLSQRSGRMKRRY